MQHRTLRIILRTRTLSHFTRLLNVNVLADSQQTNGSRLYNTQMRAFDRMAPAPARSIHHSVSVAWHLASPLTFGMLETISYMTPREERAEVWPILLLILSVSECLL